MPKKISKKKSRSSKRKRAKSYSLSIFLSKKGVSKKDCVNKEKLDKFGAKKVELKASFPGDLYLYTSPSEIPDWVRYLNPVSKNADNLANKLRAGHSNSGLLVLPVEKTQRNAILAFGYGKSFIKYDSIEAFFGRNVVLNSMEEDKILSLKSRSYDKQPRHKENQGTVGGSLNEFEIDLQNEILQRLTGEYAEDFFEGEGFESQVIGRKLTGYDSLTFSTSIPLE